MKISNYKSQIINYIQHPLFSGGVLMVGGNLGVNGVNYVYHLVMGRILGPTDYGILASIFSIFYIISIVPFSSSFAIVKFISEAKNKTERDETYFAIRRFVWKVAIGGGIFILLLSPLTSDFLHIENVLSILFVGPIFFLSMIVLVDQAAMQGILKFIGVVIPNFVSASGKLILGILLIMLGLSVTGAVGAVLISSVLTYFVTIYLSKGLFGKSKSENFDLSRFLTFAFPVLVQALAFTALFTVDVILAKHFLSPFDAGLYAALSTLGKIIYFATQPIASTMFPIVAGRRARGEKYKTIFIAAFLVTTVASVMIVGFYSLFPRIAIGILYGESYLSVSRELVWMGAFLGIFSLSSLMVNFLLSIGRVRIVFVPIVAAMCQIAAIMIWHRSILDIIQVSLVVTLALFATLVVYLGREWIKQDFSLS